MTHFCCVTEWQSGGVCSCGRGLRVLRNVDGQGFCFLFFFPGQGQRVYAGRRGNGRGGVLDPGIINNQEGPEEVVTVRCSGLLQLVRDPNHQPVSLCVCQLSDESG